MILREYQVEASEWLSRRARGVVCLAAGGGKTIVAAAALNRAINARVRDLKVRVGWMANTIEQVEQARKAIRLFPDVVRQDVELACAAAGTDWSDRDVLVVDECHHGIAPSWLAQISTCAGARWGLTATPPEDAEDTLKLRELLGEFLVIDRSRVNHSLAPATVRWRDATDPNLQPLIDARVDRTVAMRSRWWKGDPGQLWGQVAWQAIVEIGIIENRLRNRDIITAAGGRAQTLVLVNQIEHGKSLAERISGAVPCFSKMGTKARKGALEGFITGDIRCLVATSLADEGLDLPNASVLVMGCGGRSNARTEQRTGRVLRQFAGKSRGLIYDYTDTFHPLAAKHSRIRGELYKKLGYHIEG